MEPQGAHQAKTFHVDHIQELQIGGKNAIENMWLLEGTTNIQSGAQILANIGKQVRRFLKAAEPTLEETPTFAQVRDKYTVTWNGVKTNGKRPSDAQYWEKTDIEQGAHTKLLEELTNPKLKGSPDNLAVYNSPGGGSVTYLAPGKDNQKGGKNYRLKTVNWTAGGKSPGTGEVGTIGVEVFKKNKVLEEATFDFPIEGMPGVDYGGFIDRTKIGKKAGRLQAKFASPIELPDLDFDLDKGLVGRGRIPKPDLKLLERVSIDVILDGDEVGIEATIGADDLSLPGPFKVTGGELTLGATTAGVSAVGRIDFEIKDLATGHIQAGAAIEGRQRVLRARGRPVVRHRDVRQGRHLALLQGRQVGGQG